MTQPESLERERASDVPEGVEVRADGSYVTPVEDLTDEQKALLVPSSTEEQDQARKDEEERLERESAELDSPPREIGSPDAFGGAQ